MMVKVTKVQVFRPLQTFHYVWSTSTCSEIGASYAPCLSPSCVTMPLKTASFATLRYTAVHDEWEQPPRPEESQDAHYIHEAIVQYA